MEFTKHIVKKGENLTKIAKKYGFAGGDWKKLYNHPKNTKLKRLRPNPDHIEPKDEVFIPNVPGKKIDEEIKALTQMEGKLMSMPPRIKKSMMEAVRMQKEAMRIVKHGAVIHGDIVTLKGLNANYQSHIMTIDAQMRAADQTGKMDTTERYVKNFKLFQRRQDMLAKMIDGLSTIADAERHLAGDPKKAMYAVQGMGVTIVKQQKMMSEWTKAHADVLKEIRARKKLLTSERKETV